ncbi:MAG: hypothetical protein EOM91_11450 [Sphingobacteriia bacterium]|nr:hypothetical protein [Sphingobacteriia bacterium]NCC38213.1 hypothetical protein [Gammaproteobacteria bacterium]
MSESFVGYCWHCAQGLTQLDYARANRCPGCDRPTHCCRNCRHYAPGRANECREPLVERVVEKDRANFCDWFAPQTQRGPATTPTDDPDALRHAAEALFK